MTINTVKYWHRLSGALMITILFSWSMVNPVQAKDGFKITSGWDFSSGEYDQDIVTHDTTTYSWPLSISYRTGSWRIKGSIPYTVIKGPEYELQDDGAGGTVEQEVVKTQRGFGDLWLTVTHELDINLTAGVAVDLSAKLKLPLADRDKGLGTGRADGVLQMDFFHRLDRDWYLLGGVGYKWKGSSPTYDPRNVWLGSLGTQYLLDRKNSLGLILDYQQATSDTSADIKEIMGLVSHRWNKTWSGSFYMVHGLTESTPDLGGGFQLSYRFQ
ncbi:MAG: transporter [Magnetococcales bacterium]|nr:transporter [Magnetococcales bacterium]